MKRFALLGLSVLFGSIAAVMLMEELRRGLAWLSLQIDNDGYRLVVAALFVYLAGVAYVLSKRFR